MIHAVPLKDRDRKLTLAVLLLAMTAACVLVWVHAEHVHESAISSDKCMVCSWANSMATIGASHVVVATVPFLGRIEALPLLLSRAFHCRLHFSARAPPGCFDPICSDS